MKDSLVAHEIKISVEVDGLTLLLARGQVSAAYALVHKEAVGESIKRELQKLIKVVETGGVKE